MANTSHSIVPTPLQGSLPLRSLHQWCSQHHGTLQKAHGEVLSHWRQSMFGHSLLACSSQPFCILQALGIRSKDEHIKQKREEEIGSRWQYDKDAMREWESFIKQSKSAQVMEDQWWDLDDSVEERQPLPTITPAIDWNK
ncbi:hypothetical protein WJX75_005424 [Coccomyxa subellipsoidea]|uniref:Uncharacterized protein n=1 Tax=Coccomyxa subellipsoidea TaxID=248742 RepID=A0ABR2Z350_9CHLO